MPRKLTRIAIDNFQSHLSTEMEMSEGLNVITGESDQGKTAILRALKWLFFNEPRGTDFIRIGAGECRVTVETDDGVIVTRERSSSRNRYVLSIPGKDPQIFEGFGSKVPAEVVAALGVEPVVLDDDMSIPLNLGEQLDAPFLLGESGTVKAKAIGRICGVHIVDAAIRNVQRDIGRLQHRQRELEKNISSYEDKLASFADLPGLERSSREAEDLIAGAQEIHSRAELCRRLGEELKHVRGQISRLEATLRSLAEIETAERELSTAVDAGIKATRLIDQRANLVRTRDGILSATGIIERTASVEEALALLDEAVSMRERGVLMSKLRVDLGRERIGQNQMVSRIEEAREKTRELVLEYQSLLMKEGKCPTCFGSVTDEVIRRIAGEYLGGDELYGDGTDG